MDPYQDRIRPLLDSTGLTDVELEKFFALPRGTIYKWNQGANRSYRIHCLKLSQYFHVSTDYLLGLTDDPGPQESAGPDRPQAITDDDLKFALWGDREIDDAVLNQVKQFAKFFQKRES